MKFEPKKDIKRIIVICVSSVLMALNIKTFVRTGGLFPGGATGLPLLFQRMGEMFFQVEIPYTILNVAINAVPVYIGFRFIGKKFTLFSCLSIVLTSVLTDILPGYAIIYDTLLIAVFGGMISGLAIKALYSIIFQYASTQVLHILYKKYQQQTLAEQKDVVRAIREADPHAFLLQY